MTDRPVRERTPSRRVLEQQNTPSATPTARRTSSATPAARRSRSQPAALAIRKQAANASQRRSLGGRGAASLAAPPSAQQARKTRSPSPASEEDDGEDDEEDDEEDDDDPDLPRVSVEGASPPLVQVTAEEAARAFVIDLRVRGVIDGKGLMTQTRPIHAVDLWAVFNTMKTEANRVLKAEKREVVDEVTAPVPLRLLVGKTSRYEDVLMHWTPAVFMDSDDAWHEFVLPFLIRAVDIDKARKAGTQAAVLDMEIRFVSRAVKRRSHSVVDLSSSSADTDNDDSTQARRKKRSKKDKVPKSSRRTSTQVMRRDVAHNRDINDAEGVHYPEIRENFLCDAASCINFEKHVCYDTKLPGKFDGHAPGHISLGQDLVKWNKLVRDDKEKADIWPTSIVEKLMRKRKAQITEQAKSKSATPAVQAGGQTTAPFTIINNIGSGSSAAMNAPAVEPVRSSPPMIVGDDDVLRDEYMIFLANKYPLSRSDLVRYNGVLAEHGWGFRMISAIDKEAWEAMKIPAGFRLRIKMHWKAYARERDVDGDSVSAGS
ncbi:hypothetical protein LTR47_009917 [Exophiala xenobiotica]|nr:hypothetical protein LTR47_009917 [Exophiala xenobiotica]KAK5250339.1 hypothetical protein LTS06_004917 [Exophiala xenobiotica]KAK5284239.1 hypothetical protein LTR40_000517 [Exophiala xenobiotica]KAK5345798.1 hypothetical protein LTR61_010499 [Exophiala xenobiotica]KAK5359172.1 hypothetical protein LTR11_010600 [Exophiala xenobiotica]